MSKAKLLVVACFAVFAFSGMVASTASAGEWQIEGETFTTGETRALLPTALVLATGRLNVPSLNTEVVCKGEKLDLNNGKIIYPDGILVQSVVFHECSTENTGECSLGSTLISTVPIHGLVHLEGILHVLILLLPQTKTTFATIAFEGAKCALAGTQPVTEKAGGFHLLIDHGQVFKLLHLVLPITLAGGLKVGLNEAELTGADWDIALNSHHLFRFL